MTLFDSAFQGASLEIETNVTGPITIPLDNVLQSDGSGPGPVVRALAPRVRLVRNGQVLYQAAPAGAPNPDVRAAVWAVLVVLTSLAVLLLTTAKGRSGILA